MRNILFASVAAMSFLFAGAAKATPSILTYNSADVSGSGFTVFLGNENVWVGPVQFTNPKINGVASTLLQAWCVDLNNNLVTNNGSYTIGNSYTTDPNITSATMANEIGALINAFNTGLTGQGTFSGDSKNLQGAVLHLAIWEIEYGNLLNARFDNDNGAILNLAAAYKGDVIGTNPTWTLPTGDTLSILSAYDPNCNQILAYLTSDPPASVIEPTSMTLLATGIFGVGFIRRRKISNS